MITTSHNEDLIAFYKHGNKTFRIIDKVDDFRIEEINGDNPRYFSTHSGLTLLADIQMALNTYLNCKVLQKDIDLTF